MEKMDNYKLRIENIMNSYKRLLFRNDNIVGFGIGVKIIVGNWTSIPCLTIYVKEKISADMLDRNNIIPKYFNGVLTDIVETGKYKVSASPVFSKMSGEKLFSGMSIGNENNDFGGTITCGFSGEIKKGREKEKRKFLLGSASALTKINPVTGTIGSLGDIIVNPANEAGKKNVNSRIGRLIDIAPLDIGVSKEPSYSVHDAALILLDNTVDVLPKFGEGTKIEGISETAPGVKVYYVGAASGKVFGNVMSTKGTWTEKKTDNSGKTNIIEYSKVTVVSGEYNPGDRGAIGIVNTMSKGSYGFGMLVAGTQKTIAFTNLNESINYFKEKFNLELIK